MKIYHITLLGCLYAISLGGCNKYLDAKPDAKLQVPQTAADLQAILDNYPIINSNDPYSGEVSANDYYLTDETFDALPQENYRRMYTWQKDGLYANDNLNDWFYSYRKVFSCNTVLELSAKNTFYSKDLNDIRGQAMFLRSKSLFQLAVIYTSPYNELTADKDLGLPLRTSTDFNTPSVRANIRDTFDRITSDLKAATALLPLKPLSVYRASKPAAYGLLARIYLYMNQFEQSARYADSCLMLSSTLLDYNTLSPSKTFPISRLNDEVLFESLMPGAPPINYSNALIVNDLLNTYNNNDLRKALFFKSNDDGTYGFRGSYESGRNLFSGIATDEIYLTRAEARIRLNNLEGGLNDLNTLLAKRWVTGKFRPYSGINTSEALKLVLAERRKELLMRGIRWMDLKRLNRDGLNMTLTRKVAGQTVILPPNDLRYAIALPDNLISLSGLVQNPR